MKRFNSNYSIFLFLAIIGMTFSACVQDDDFDLPNVGEGEPAEIDGDVIPLSSIIGAIEQNEGAIQTYTYEEDIYTVGYVVSSDEGGNFFKEMVIQDEPENPTAGIRIPIDVSPLFAKYNFGRKVYIKLDGLSYGMDRNNPSIGILDGDRLGRIPEGQANEIFIRDNVVADIVPKELAINEIGPDSHNQFIKVNNVQFPLEDVTPPNHLSFAAEAYDEFDTERSFESCDSQATGHIATSTFSDFKGLKLPTQSGSIAGVVQRNFDDDKNIIKVNTPEDLNFEGERCDPEPAEPLCEGPSGGSDVIFEEDFDGVTNIGQLNGWLNINAEGNESWVIGDFNNNNYAQISGFNSGQSYDTWLVTPEIDLTGSSLEEVRLDIEASYDNGNGLSVLVTENYTGDVETTEWEELAGITVPNGPGNSFGGFEDAGASNISCLDNVRFAFRYQGSDPDGVTTRYHLDNIRIEGELD
ncbi:MAG: DUF5689 domain-containing protein [Bacteroidota bacterium]